MLNTIEFYKDLGTKAAKARNQRDESLARSTAEYFRRARGLEQGDDRMAANCAFDEAYKAARVVPPVEYFK